MVRRLIFPGPLVAITLALALVLGGSPDPAFAQVGTAQDFDLDMINCLGGTDPDPTGPIPMSCSGEDKDTSDPQPDLASAMNIPFGSRDALPYLYTGPGWEAKMDAEVPDGTVVGDLTIHMDLQCDGDIDFMADETSAPPATIVPEDYVERTTSWGPGTGPFGGDETYLDTLVPPTSVMTPNIRYRSDLDTAWLELAPGLWYPYPLGRNVVPGNVINMHPVWSPAGTTASLVISQAAPDSPTAVLSCAQSTSSLSHIDGGTAPNWVVSNPTSPGLYVRWITETSAADHYDGTINFTYTTSCKAIGGSFTDADSDCLVDTDPDDTDAGTNADRDGDLLLDGVEVAWGSDPDDADTDDDGRTDLEEMIGPTQFLSNPTDADTDDDGVDDGGLIADANGDGVPDCPDENGDTTCDTGIGSNSDTSGDGSSHVRVGVKIVGTDIVADNLPELTVTRTVASACANDVQITIWKGVDTDIKAVDAGDGTSGTTQKAAVRTAAGNPETWKVEWTGGECVDNGETIKIRVKYTGAEPTIQTVTWTDGGAVIGSQDVSEAPVAPHPDNCASISNPGQVNTDLDAATEHGNGDFYGDACDDDDDQDFFNDLAEQSFEYDPIARSCDNDKDVFDSGEGFYSTANGNALSSTNPDSDADGVLDGRECQFGSNPADASSTPALARATYSEPDGDADGLVEGTGMLERTAEKYFRTKDILGQAKVDPDNDTFEGDDDADSDGDTLPDGCEALITGTSPVNKDTDGDGTDDNLEFGAGICGTGLTDLDSDLVLNDVDTCLTAANAGAGQSTNTDAVIGNGKGIGGDDGTVAFEDNIPDACDGDRDNDLIGNALTGIAPCSVDDGTAGVDITYDDDGNGTMLDGSDDGPSWDEDGNAVLDGWEASCYGGQTIMQDRYLNTDGQDDDDVDDADDDDDGLEDVWEVKKWGTNPLTWNSITLRADTDGDGDGDCKEAADVNGDGIVDFVGDTIFYAKAALLPDASFGKDGDFDINGDGIIDFVGDVIQEAKFALIAGLCK